MRTLFERLAIRDSQALFETQTVRLDLCDPAFNADLGCGWVPGTVLEAAAAAAPLRFSPALAQAVCDPLWRWATADWTAEE